MMHPARRSASARPSPLLALPPAVLGSVLEHLTPRELVRAVTMTTKHSALFSFLEGADPGEAALWTRALRHCLGRITSAREWFELTADKPTREKYAEHAQAVQEALESLLEEAGLEGVQWRFLRGRWSGGTVEFVLSSVPLGKTMDDFVAWAEAFACSDCDEYAMATRQCAACGSLLCSDCALGFTPKFGTCNFTLCGDCKDAHTISQYDCLDTIPDTPYSVLPLCSKCPESVQWCLAHAPMGWLCCQECYEERCMDHFCDAPMLQVCVECGFTLCDRPACQRNSNKFFDYCSRCYLPHCSDCAAKVKWRCTNCKLPLLSMEYADN